MLQSILLISLLLMAASGSAVPRRVKVDTHSENYNKIRPIIYMHGIFADGSEVDYPTKFITQQVPDAVLYSIRLWENVDSAVNLYTQLNTIIPAMQKIMDNHTDTGVTLLCYSQGGVICRAAVQMMSKHNVHTLITLSSPLDGQYGVTNYVSWLIPNKDRSAVYELFYTKLFQYFSIANYWNDPHHQTEFSDPKLDVIIARLNNQTGHNMSSEYKANFLRLQKLVMIGGPSDEVITPWQSAQFGFYDESENVLPYEKQPWFANDAFGLKTLHDAGRVVRHTISGVGHTEWIKTKSVYDVGVIPYIR